MGSQGGAWNTVFSIIGATCAIVALIFKYIELEEKHRKSVAKIAKSFFSILFFLFVILNSSFGMYQFFTAAGDPKRSEIGVLLMHLFNIYFFSKFWIDGKISARAEARSLAQQEMLENLAASIKNNQ